MECGHDGCFIINIIRLALGAKLIILRGYMYVFVFVMDEFYIYWYQDNGEICPEM